MDLYLYTKTREVYKIIIPDGSNVGNGYDIHITNIENGETDILANIEKLAFDQYDNISTFNVGNFNNYSRNDPNAFYKNASDYFDSVYNIECYDSHA